MARKTIATKEEVSAKLTGFDKPSHSGKLAQSLLRGCETLTDLDGRISRANAVVAEVRKAGVTSFFGAEYGALFSDPQKAADTRNELVKHFKDRHGLDERKAAKMADCIVFAAAKKPGMDSVSWLKTLSSEAIAAGVAFDVVADTVYYNAPAITPEKFSSRCAMTANTKGKPMPLSQEELTERLGGVAKGEVPPQANSAAKEDKAAAVQGVLDELDKFNA